MINNHQIGNTIHTLTQEKLANKVMVRRRSFYVMEASKYAPSYYWH